MSAEHTSSLPTDGFDFNAADFNDDFGWVEGFTTSLKRHSAPEAYSKITNY